MTNTDTNTNHKKHYYKVEYSFNGQSLCRYIEADDEYEIVRYYQNLNDQAEYGIEEPDNGYYLVKIIQLK